jgi:hypothetical protein
LAITFTFELFIPKIGTFSSRAFFGQIAKALRPVRATIDSTGRKLQKKAPILLNSLDVEQKAPLASGHS